VSIDNADSDSHGDTERNSYGYANPHSNANSDTNSYGNADRDSYSYADTYTNCDSNSNTYCNTDRNSIWEYMPPANDGESYSCSQHAVQFHGSGQRDRCDAEDSFKRRSRS
jgi:hypothetical protein